MINVGVFIVEDNPTPASEKWKGEENHRKYRD